MRVAGAPLQAGEGGARSRGARSRGAPSLLIALSLALVTFSAFSGSLDGPFLEFDDKQYVVENPVVRAGLTWGGVSLAATRAYAANWHPLTWVSLMLDAEIFGLEPRGFHLTNVVLHTANAVLLFLLARSLTGALWRSALVAALFAVHPLRVESVAWIAERKDVLSAFFGFLALLAYVRHVRRPGAGSYLLTTLLFALGLAAKPTIVTWPLLLLILDGWPLGRWAPGGPLGPAGAGSGVHSRGRHRAVAARLLLEKTPWFLLSAAVSVVTFVAQSRGGAVVALEEPLGARLLNVLWAYSAYLAKALWPLSLAAYYPFEDRTFFSLPVLGSAALLLAITGSAWRGARRNPWIAAGWCWYLVSLVPMIGVVRVGSHSMADRYTYIALIGPAVALVWAVGRWARQERSRRIAAACAMTAVILALAGRSRFQTAFWLTDEALFRRMCAVVPDNPFGLLGLGGISYKSGRVDEAERFYRDSIRSHPRYIQAYKQLGRLYRETGRMSEAEEAYRQGLKLKPDDAMAQSVLAMMLQKNGKLEEAAEHLGIVVALEPWLAEGHNNLGVVLDQLGRSREAAEHFRRALEIDPRFAAARENLETVQARSAEPR